jgi:hypothetical protein
MTEQQIDVRTVLSFAIELAGDRITADQIVRALKVGGYQIVSANPNGPGASGLQARGDALEHNAGASTGAKNPPPEKYPQFCAKCPKVINDRAHAREVSESCEVAGCPW